MRIMTIQIWVMISLSTKSRQLDKARPRERAGRSPQKTGERESGACGARRGGEREESGGETEAERDKIKGEDRDGKAVCDGVENRTLVKKTDRLSEGIMIWLWCVFFNMSSFFLGDRLLLAA